VRPVRCSAAQSTAAATARSAPWPARPAVRCSAAKSSAAAAAAEAVAGRGGWGNRSRQGRRLDAQADLKAEPDGRRGANRAGVRRAAALGPGQWPARPGPLSRRSSLGPGVTRTRRPRRLPPIERHDRPDHRRRGGRAARPRTRPPSAVSVRWGLPSSRVGEGQRSI